MKGSAASAALMEAKLILRFSERIFCRNGCSSCYFLQWYDFVIKAIANNWIERWPVGFMFAAVYKTQLFLH